MKKLVAFLLTLALLMGMVGTVSVAAEEELATIPDFTATVAKDGTVTVKVDDGVKDYTTHYARVYRKGEEESRGRTVLVELEYNSSKKAYIGQNEEVAGGTISSVTLSKSEGKPSTKGDTETFNSVIFSASYSDGKVLSAEYTEESFTDKITEDSDGKIHHYITDQETEYNYKSFNTETGKVASERNYQIELTGDKKEQSVKTTNKTNRYSYGVLSAQTVTNNEVTRDADAWTYRREYDDGYSVDEYELSRKTNSKTYNEDNVMTSSSESESELTYNKKKDARDYEYNAVNKQFSNKGYLKSTTKTTQTRSDELNDDEEWDTEKAHHEYTSTNRDGKLSFTEEGTRTNGKGEAFTETTIRKNYNTYTGALSESSEIELENSLNKKTEEYEATRTSTTIENNTDGSLRRKVIEKEEGFIYSWRGGEEFIGETTKETHYNSNNKVAAEYTYDPEDEVGTWKDGNGKVLGKNEKDKDSDDYTKVTSIDFKNRTGELNGWATKEQTTDKKGTVTVTETSYDQKGKKSSETEKITKDDGSWKYYENGVLRNSYDPEDLETKYYDVKGSLSSTSILDDDEIIVTNYDDKVIQKSGYNDDDEYVITNYNPETGKKTDSIVSYNDDEGYRVYEYRDAKDKIKYSTKYYYNDDEERWVTGYYDAKGKEFAYTYGGEDADEYQKGYRWDSDGAPTQIEHKETEHDYDYRKDTTTEDYTKWTISDGKKTDKRTRTDKTIHTWDYDKDEYSVYVDGTLTYNKVDEKNDYDNTAKSTVKQFNWYDGSMTGMEKTIYTDEPDDAITYYKRYDRYSNLQEYSETDDADRWEWSYTYYADGTFKGEHWEDGLDRGENYYDSKYYLYGGMASEENWTGKGKYRNGRSVSYNKDGSYSYWADIVNGVTNAWLYNSDGILQGYRWNQKKEDGVSSFEMWDAAGTLLYTETNYGYEDRNLDYPWVSVTTKTDPAGNKWESKNYNGETTVTLTLKNKGNGWQYAVGEWFYLEKGEPVTDEWRQIDGSWYYFNGNGEMSTGLIAIQDKKDADKYTTYAANYDGSLGNGWTLLDDGYGGWAYTDVNGEVLTGWQRIDGAWYYFEDGWYEDTYSTRYKEDVEWKQDRDRGTMVTGAARIWNSDWKGMHTYFFNEDGTWDNSPGWKVTDDWEDIEYHYYNKNRVEVTGWNYIDGAWYYFNEDGVMKNGWVKSGNNWYFMDPKKGGAMATNGWTEDVYEGWYYMDKNGQYKTGWLNDGGTWYYLKSDGAMAENEWAKSGNNWYYMGTAGNLQTGWVQDHGDWYHLDGNGAMESNKWIGSGNTWYYMGADGAMAVDTDVTIGGKTYHFDETGLCTNP